MVGSKNNISVESFTPMRMVLDLYGDKFVLIRDTSNMTASEKAALDEEMNAMTIMH